MGIDLITIIVKGPIKLSKRHIKKAEREAAKIIQFAADIYAAHEKEYNGGTLSKKEMELLDSGLRHPRMQGFRSEEQLDRVKDALDLGLRDMAQTTAKKEVKDFVEWWHCEEGRDVCSRFDPDDHSQKIVVCGGDSGGDMPEGYGYQTLRRANWFEILDNLGIR